MCVKAAQQRVPSLRLQLLVRSMQTGTARSQHQGAGPPLDEGQGGTGWGPARAGAVCLGVGQGSSWGCIAGSRWTWPGHGNHALPAATHPAAAHISLHALSTCRVLVRDGKQSHLQLGDPYTRGQATPSPGRQLPLRGSGAFLWHSGKFIPPTGLWDRAQLRCSP